MLKDKGEQLNARGSVEMEFSPTAISLLPSNLFDSPNVTLNRPNSDQSVEVIPGEQYISIPPPIQSFIKHAQSPSCPGLQLTTSSGMTVIIQDPYAAERLILSPLCSSLIRCARLWFQNGHDTEILDELLRFRNMLSTMFEEYISVFGCIPGSFVSPVPYYLDYVCNCVSDVEDRRKLLEALRMAQQFSSSNGSISSSSSKSSKSSRYVDQLNQSFDKASSEWTRPSDHGKKSTENDGFKMEPSDDFKPVQKFEKTVDWFSVLVNHTDESDKKCAITAKRQNPIEVHHPKKLLKSDDAIYNVRYKTQPCRHYANTGGHCPAAENCHFAHGPEELRSPKGHPKFRTKVCRNFAENGHCNFGDNCFFQHVKLSPKQ